MIHSFRYVEDTALVVVDGVPTPPGMFGRLEIVWANGSKGAYLDVNRRTYEDFAAAESRGKFLNSVIKPGFRYERSQEAVDDAKPTEQASTPEVAPDAPQ
jgi:hypothetical protein